MKRKRNKGVISMLLAMAILATPTGVSAESLELPVEFMESTQQNQNKTITLPANAVVLDVQADNGIVQYSKKGNEISLTISEGQPYRNEYNSQKNSRYEQINQTKASNSFESSVFYNSGGYSGTLSKNGSSYLSSGSYTPASSMFVTNQTSSSYNSGGYSGYLSSYVYSGSYTPFHEDYISGYREGSYTWGEVCLGGDGSYSWKSEASVKPVSWISYNSNGYSGTLSLYTWSGVHEQNGNTCGSKPYKLKKYKNHYAYRGYVVRPEQDTRTYRYQGTVSKPASDTRNYTQSYSGVVFSGGYDTTYRYSVSITYEIDTLGIPRIVFSYDEAFTNGNVVIHVKAFSPNEKRIVTVTSPNGSLHSSSELDYLVTENGLYTFSARDDDGAVGYGSVIIQNIDRKKPGVDMETPLDWVKEDPLLTITATE